MLCYNAEMAQEQNGADLEALLRHNTELLEENYALLKRLYQYGVMTFWLRILWYLFLVVVPFILYFYVLQPYIAQLNMSYREFSASVEHIPGWKEVLDAFNGMRSNSQ